MHITDLINAFGNAARLHGWAEDVGTKKQEREAREAFYKAQRELLHAIAELQKTQKLEIKLEASEATEAIDEFLKSPEYAQVVIEAERYRWIIEAWRKVHAKGFGPNPLVFAPMVVLSCPVSVELTDEVINKHFELVMANKGDSNE